ncbi:NUDIX domain-containing protein [Anaerobacillus sp. HL2]|nr:NUDIX domain-containing protein [Anaerobacillus sp. HL2]
MLIHQRPSKGLLASLWNFQFSIRTIEQKICLNLEEEYGLSTHTGEEVLQQSTFSHLKWKITVFS